jgi:hypothetical protein
MIVLMMGRLVWTSWPQPWRPLELAEARFETFLPRPQKLILANLER